MLRVRPTIILKLRPVRQKLLRYFPNEELHAWRDPQWMHHAADLERDLARLTDEADPEKWRLVRQASSLLAARSSSSYINTIRLLEDAQSGLNYRASGKKTGQDKARELHSRNERIRNAAADMLDRNRSRSAFALASDLYRKQSKLFGTRLSKESLRKIIAPVFKSKAQK
jgi:hypothetical protein